jgi:DNA repair protein SbcD/Mre11
MNILLTGDLHLTDKTPENRIDNYPETVLNKFKFILNFAKEKKVKFILQPGDLFDSPNPSYSLFTKVVRMINEHEIPIYTVFGQHDLRYRNSGNTGLLALSASCPDMILNPNSIGGEISIQSAGWEEIIPKPRVSKYNILITHRMIIHKKLWEGQEDYEIGSEFLKTHKFDLIVSGDNHQFFIENIGKRWLINCGSMMRSTIAQTEHFPCVMLYDTATVDWSEINIPIKPAEEVFKMEQVMKTKERDEKLEAFVEGLSSHKEMGLSFEENLLSYMAANNVDPSIQEIIRRNML